MKVSKKIRTALAGTVTGAVNGLFGAGGGMILVPMLTGDPAFGEEQVFASSLAIILPICVVSLLASSGWDLPWKEALPFLIGGIPGGILAATLGKRIPTVWLHRILGILILYGGIRYLW